jgi:hypothetical protein
MGFGFDRGYETDVVRPHGLFGTEEVRTEVHRDIFGDTEVRREIVDRDMFGNVQDVRTEIVDRDAFGRVEDVRIEERRFW